MVKKLVNACVIVIENVGTSWAMASDHKNIRANENVVTCKKIGSVLCAISNRVKQFVGH